ncbi:hypothetical protein ACFFKU_05000 [Kineococcus gynurae]|uniref:ThiF family protein n=1 Tax=Kineococcus gynurae TaxID=452979 RepID=A0ABV5LN80_9ACTN
MPALPADDGRTAETLREFAALPVVHRPDGTVQVGSSPRSLTRAGPLTVEDRRALRAAQGLDPDTERRRLAVLHALVGAGAIRPGRLRARPERVRAQPRLARLAPDARAWATWDPLGPDGPDRLAARGRRCVAVVGTGRVGSGVAELLRAAGVGTVLVHDDTPTLDADRGGRTTGPGSTGPEAVPDLVVLVEHHRARSESTGGLVAHGTAHLSVVLRDTDAVVGPLVRPGAGPCLRCLDLHRSDADADWPLVAAQLSHGPPALEETASAALVAGLAAVQVLAHLDGAEATTVHASLEVALPEGWVVPRSWTVHPGCGCGGLPPEPLRRPRR